MLFYYASIVVLFLVLVVILWKAVAKPAINRMCPEKLNEAIVQMEAWVEELEETRRELAAKKRELSALEEEVHQIEKEVEIETDLAATENMLADRRGELAKLKAVRLGMKKEN